FVEQLLEAGDAPRLPPELIVETQHLDDQPGAWPRSASEFERRCCIASGRLNNHVAVIRRQTGWPRIQTGMKHLVEFVPGGKYGCSLAGHQPRELARRSRVWNENDTRHDPFGIAGPRESH